MQVDLRGAEPNIRRELSILRCPVYYRPLRTK
jgi:hypothetical protein